jgi:hypothetical protein
MFEGRDIISISIFNFISNFTAKVISIACCSIVYLLGMIFMWLIFIQVRSANIMSMLYLHNVRGD